MSSRRQPFTVAIVERTEATVVTDVVTLAGVIDEAADLRPLSALGRRPIEIDLRGVQRINSSGVRTWIDFVRAVPREVPLRFVRCPPAIIDQCNMVNGFLGHGRLESFYAPLACRECDEQVEQLYTTAEVRAGRGKLPPTPCPRCRRPMAIDDLEDQYLSFVREAT
ncbi:MAG TPA: hypothetical protein VHE35_11105 [Kofleriaceae bacterium]|nr:hypothetical protein [Kofleriaceae bacterium]